MPPRRTRRASASAGPTATSEGTPRLPPLRAVRLSAAQTGRPRRPRAQPPPLPLPTPCTAATARTSRTRAHRGRPLFPAPTRTSSACCPSPQVSPPALPGRASHTFATPSPAAGSLCWRPPQPQPPPLMANLWACAPPRPCPRPAAFWILFVEFVGYFLVAIYLDHVLPDENGALPAPRARRGMPPRMLPCFPLRHLLLTLVKTPCRRAVGRATDGSEPAPAPAAAGPAGVRKGRPWYFLSPFYWCGASWRRSKKHAVRTARRAAWACPVGPQVPPLAGTFGSCTAPPVGRARDASHAACGPACHDSPRGSSVPPPPARRHAGASAACGRRWRVRLRWTRALSATPTCWRRRSA